MSRVLRAYLLLFCCVAALGLVVLAFARSYGRPTLYAKVSPKRFSALSSCNGQLSWISHELFHNQWTFSSLSLEKNVLTCHLDLPQRRHARGGDPPPVMPASTTSDLPLIGGILPQWSEVSIPSPGSELDETPRPMEQLREVAIPYWCPTLLAASAVYISARSLRNALRRQRFARIGRCEQCGREIGEAAEECPECATAGLLA